MAKSSAALKEVENYVDHGLLLKITHGTVKFVTKTEGESVGLLHSPPLIEVNIGMIDPEDPMKVLCRITPAGAQYLTANNNFNEVNPVTSGYEVITNAVLPSSKRGGGGGGAPIKYPFDKLEVGNSFFVPATAKLPNPLKTLGSTISSANLRYANVTGEKVVTRAKRGEKNKLVLDANGDKIMETKTVPVYEFTRKFSIRGVEAGKSYGSWVAPDNGALIARVQ
jgi:hypothetical protein